ncbi:MAG: ParA family protein [Bryobacteraceae bacterium]
MYVITFYSFKGGVGRSLALANVAVDLAQHGKRVLLVDFDLEAPGLDAFKPLRPKRLSPGIVEFVTTYIETGVSPDAAQFICEAADTANVTGEMLVMPSGLRNKTYSGRLGDIDWQKLYRQQEGYLLFEDLRAQWDKLGVDYVLVDSRTGHTDVAGICTRQLPNAVAICFLPNEENLSGLETIVEEIRNETQVPRQIELYFIAACIPRLDDDENILSRRFQDAGRRLGFERPDCIIHRYDNLALLDNSIFVLERPRSGLADEYRYLTEVITARNYHDRDVALRLLKAFGTGRDVTDRTLEIIRRYHLSDGEVIHWLGKLAQRMHFATQAAALFSESEALGYRGADKMLDLAEAAHRRGDLQGAHQSAHDAIRHSTCDYFELMRAARLFVRIHPPSVELLRESPVFQTLGPQGRAHLLDRMLIRREALPALENFIRREDRRPGSNPSNSLLLCLIGQGKFKEAMAEFRSGRPDPQSAEMTDAFNFGMAEWGQTGQPPKDLFERALQLADAREPRTKNLVQCLSIAAWACGHIEQAEGYLRIALDLARADDSDSFSGWRYLTVSGDQFLADLEEIRQMISGAPVRPPVFTANRK